MVQQGSLLTVTDKTGVVIVQCIKVFGGSKKRIAYLGDVILFSIKKVSSKKFFRSKGKKKRKFFKGTVFRGLVIRSKVNFMRGVGLFIKFDQNGLILVNKKNVPISNRIYGPVLKEICMK